jgi:(S)-2-hydroxy-acid oxidase
MSYFVELIDDGLHWGDVEWLKKQTSMKIVLKGIMSAQDAAKAVEHGVHGIWVSNHGGRQLDSAPACIEVLSDVLKGVQGKAEVYMDGGIMRGVDVFKALAIGARAVFIGRPVLWGLAHDGENGVYSILQLLHEELKQAMRLASVQALSMLQPSMIKSIQDYRSRL